MMARDLENFIGHNKREKEEIEQTPTGISRREFLRWGGRAAAAGLLSIYYNAVHVETPRRWSKEIQEDAPWLGGIKNLRNDAIYADEEFFALYVTNEKTGEQQWVSHARGEESTTKRGVGVLEDELERGRTKIAYAHTHPLSGAVFFGLQKEDVGKMRRENRHPFSSPPSINDLFFCIWSQNEGDERSTKVIQYVVDPQYVWEFGADMGHPFVKDLLCLLHKDEMALEKLKREPAVLRIIEKIPERVLIPRLFEQLKTGGALDTLEAESRSTIQDVLQSHNFFYDQGGYGGELLGLSLAIGKYSEASLREDYSAIELLIPRYKQLGISVIRKTFDGM